MKPAPYLGVTIMRQAFVDAGYPVTGKVGTFITNGWRVLRNGKPRKRKRRNRR